MRAVLLIVIVAILVTITAVATGFLNVRQIRAGAAPEVTATRSGITAKGGRAPAFDVETGSVKVGSKATSVKVPTLKVQKAAENQQAPVTNQAM